MRSPKVSVVVPMYEAEVFLIRCVESIRAQTLEDIEIILVDDASPDGCAALAEEFAEADPRVRLVRHGESCGLGPARNTGMGVARGEYIGFVDSDDWVEPGMYEGLCKSAAESGADIVFGGFKIVANDRVRDVYKHPFAGQVLLGSDEIAQVRKHFYGPLPNRSRGDSIPLSACSAVYRRDFLEKHQLRFANARSEDVLFNVCACREASAVACVGSTDYCYRKDGQPSITTTFNSRTPASFSELFRLLASVVADEPEELRGECRLRVRRRVIDCSWALVILIESSAETAKAKGHLVAEALVDPALRAACEGYPFWRLPLPKMAFYLCERFNLVGAARALARARNALRGVGHEGGRRGGFRPPSREVARARSLYVATIIDVHNYGTVMQAVATSELLRAYGRPTFVDYCRPELTRPGWAAKRMAAKGNAFAKVVKLAAALPSRLKSERVFRGFVEKNLGLCSAEPFLEGGEFDSDAVYIVGSDQTWNSAHNCGISPLYFLANVPDSCRKVALSASFGRESLEEWEREETARLLRRFGAVSVRERSSVAILASLGVRGGVALKDPVLLCDPQLWRGLADPGPQDRLGGYVLVYMLSRDGRLVEHARWVAREHGLRVRVVTFSSLRPVPRGTRRVCLPTPEKWLALFRDASYVVTDSFHGTCFSLVFEHPFTAFDPPRFAVRISDVLADFGLSEREVPAGAPADAVRVHELSVDWSEVRRLKERFRAEAHEFLDGCLL